MYWSDKVKKILEKQFGEVERMDSHWSKGKLHLYVKFVNQHFKVIRRNRIPLKCEQYLKDSHLNGKTLNFERKLREQNMRIRKWKWLGDMNSAEIERYDTWNWIKSQFRKYYP